MAGNRSSSSSMAALLVTLVTLLLAFTSAAPPSSPPPAGVSTDLIPSPPAVPPTTIKGPPVWSIPNLDMIFCPLRPTEPCPGLTIVLTVNLAEGEYTIAGGEDVKCRTVIPFMHFGSEWHQCENPKLFWRWEPRDQSSPEALPWFFPIAEGGETSIGIRMLEGPDDKDELKSVFKFRTTHITKLAGGTMDAVVGCYIDPREPIRCSFNNMLLLGYDPPQPVLLNVTEVKNGGAELKDGATR